MQRCSQLIGRVGGAWRLTSDGVLGASVVELLLRVCPGSIMRPQSLSGVSGPPWPMMVALAVSFSQAALGVFSALNCLNVGRVCLFGRG